MNKKLKMVFGAFLGMLCLTLVILNNTSVIKADQNFNISDPSISQAIKKIDEVTSLNYNGEATLFQTNVSSYNNCEVNESKLETHKTSWIQLNQSINDSDLRVVNYTAGSNTNWQGKTPTDLARIYEKENPGWKVVAGVNGDFFNIGDNSEVCGTSMQEGNFYKSHNYNYGGHGALGFFMDGSFISGIVDASGKEYVQLLDEASGEYTNLVAIEKIGGLSETGVSLLTRFDVDKSPYSGAAVKNTDLPYDLSAYTVYEINYNVQRLDRNTKKVFLKGVVTNISTGKATYQIHDANATSYLVCKDNSLKLNVGDSIRCQSILQGDWEKVVNITGFYNQILKDGEVVDCTTIPGVNSGYINCNKNRTVMGFKEDGTPVFMVIEHKGYGAAYNECALYLKAVGCKQGFLFDGGGSSCLFIRSPKLSESENPLLNNVNNFVTINTQEDGNERSDGNAVLFVKRDPGFIISTESTRSEVMVKLNITNQNYFNKLSNIKVIVNNTELPYDENGVKFTGLNEDSIYDVKVKYQISPVNLLLKDIDGKLENSSEISNFRTKKFTYPTVNFKITNITKNTITISRECDENVAKQVTDTVIHLGDLTYNMGSNSEFVCDNLLTSKAYQLFIEYNIIDELTNKKYPAQTAQTSVTTKAFNLPVIEEFSLNKIGDDYVTFKFSYVDEDSVVSKAYVKFNDTTTQVFIKNGSVKVKNVDLTLPYNYNFTLVLEYADGGKTQEIVSNPVNVSKGEDIKIDDPIEKKGCSCKKNYGTLTISLVSAVSLLGIILKKQK